MGLRSLLLSATTAMTLALPVNASQSVTVADASTPAACRSVALMPTVGHLAAASGTAYQALLITNHASRACTLSGTPSTQFGNFVRSGGLLVFRAVGPTAKKLNFADRGKTIVVRRGAVASVTVGVETAANAPSSMCGHVANASRVRLVFRSGAELYYTLRTFAVCTKLASTLTSGVVLGTRFP